jgi:Zn finger protein HypA/HybF involved in hydrogenase expression
MRHFFGSTLQYIDTLFSVYCLCRAIQESPAHMCKTCRHQMLEHELEAHKWHHCPLCHSPLILPNSGAAGALKGDR